MQKFKEDAKCSGRMHHAKIKQNKTKQNHIIFSDTSWTVASFLADYNVKSRKLKLLWHFQGYKVTLGNNHWKEKNKKGQCQDEINNEIKEWKQTEK